MALSIRYTDPALYAYLTLTDGAGGFSAGYAERRGVFLVIERGMWKYSEGNLNEFIHTPWGAKKVYYTSHDVMLNDLMKNGKWKL